MSVCPAIQSPDLEDRTANGTFASSSPVANRLTVGLGPLFTPSPGLTHLVNGRKGEKESAHAENSATGANRFRIAFNAAARSSVAKEWHLLSAVMNVDHGPVIR